ncbi:RNA-directed DNA polymerase, eukaryota, reverse transcriptase zinc-binding domain protein [Tanacetum coccineum]
MVRGLATLKGGRGLRQGGPISPCLFTLVMEVLNLLIKSNIEEASNFKYHQGCRKCKITHLCFADDLLVLCHGDSNSVRVIKNSLDEFSGFSGLLPNLQKSIIFFGGMSIKSYINRKQVIYEINRLLKGFLWCQGDLTKGKAKVKWIYEEKLKGKSFWEIQADSSSSVGWKNILRLKDKVRNHIWWKLRNGKMVSAWHDRWCAVSPLSDVIGSREIYDARFKDNSTVSEIIQEGRWVWPDEWNNDYELLRQIQVPVLNDDWKDKAVWINRLGKELKFNIGDVWRDLRCNNDKVEWYSMIWFPQAIPRHAFVPRCNAVAKRLILQ